jgi:hypothetical protein
MPRPTAWCACSPSCWDCRCRHRSRPSRPAPC